MNKPVLERIEPEYIYVTIPAEYICVYHRILVMLADFGEEMLKDCKASCKDKNSGVIECFNMFNAAVAARKLGKTKLAETLIKYIKAKINQIYKGEDNSTDFVFPVDETGQIKAFVSCGELPIFRISSKDMQLYRHKYGNGFDEHFKLGPEDNHDETDYITTDMLHNNQGLDIELLPYYDQDKDNIYRPCADVSVKYAGEYIDLEDTIYQYYFDNWPVKRFDDVVALSPGVHIFTLVVTYKDETKIINKKLCYGVS